VVVGDARGAAGAQPIYQRVIGPVPAIGDVRQLRDDGVATAAPDQGYQGPGSRAPGLAMAYKLVESA
jgi:hypothetical protein